MKPLILAIDDQPESIELCSMLIRLFLPEYDMISALDGLNGIELARKHKPETILLDVKMPGIDGFEVCRRLKQDPTTCDIPVLMISGVMIGSKHRVSGLDAGADGYIYKPFEAPEFIAQIRSLLRIKKLADNLRQRERALESDVKQRDDQFRILVDTTPFAVLLVHEGRIVFANRAAPDLFHLPDVARLSTCDPLDLIVEREREELWRRLSSQAPPAPAPIPTEVTLLRGDGSEFQAEEYMADTTFGGRPARQIVWIDISKRRAMEAALRTSEEKLQLSQKMDALGRLSGGVAHDFNNLLTSILGYGHMLKEDETLTPHAKEDLNEILHAAERAENLVRHLLAFSHNQPVEMAPIDLNDVVMNMDRLLRRTIGADVELLTLLGENIGSVMADVGQVEQVIMNLAVNARSAMPGGGKLTIRTKRHPSRFENADGTVRDSVLLEVSDTGCGMSSDVKAHAFEPFFTTRPRGEGTGLGLATVYGIVQNCGGRIDLESEIGQGTRFRIFLPRLDIPAVRAEIGQDTSVPRGTETVLLVEDEPALRRLTTRFLRAQGYKVLEATHGQEGLDLFRKKAGDVDLILTDVVMPRMNGPDMVRRIRQETPDVAVLYITGFLRSSQFQDGSAEADVLMKPYTREILARRIRERLDAGGSRTE
ncbi:MAG: response regulator [Kiritimatiellia bacterium]|nr:response regulator [Kiritimatiellia bacterium]